LGLDQSGNIYETYARFLETHGIATRELPSLPRNPSARAVGIFPESRLASKTLSPAALATIVEEVVRAGLEPQVIVLEGEVPEPLSGATVLKIERNFKSLATAIGQLDCVVSADSLPAHLAEYLGKPVFVAAAFTNEYWLPRTCFTAGHWGLIPDASRFRHSLSRFLEHPYNT
jgi:ADP-heptose:LPS heptosyltransferase